MTKRFKPSKGGGRKSKNQVQAEHSETGVIIKKGKGLIKTALVYPNTYKAGMSSLGYQTVYRLANSFEMVSCERVFLPERPKRGKKAARPKSLESGLNLDQFDVIFFSISFENDFDHLVQLLGEAGIPLRSPDRNHTHPLVVAGGVACFLNPEPIAPFIDLFLIGEAEILLPAFFDVYQHTPVKSDLLHRIETEVAGAYVPENHEEGEPFSVQVQYVKSLKSIITASQIITQKTAFKDTFLIETLKGCPHGCRFCSAGFIYRPPRIYPAQNIYQAMDTIGDQTDKVGLVSSAVADHPKIIDICNYGLSKGLKLGFSSLRADKLNPDLINVLSKSKVKTATIAPEAGSQRMRNVINKRLTENNILSAVQKLVQAGVINLKLYYMIGLPFETREDVLEIVSLTQKIKTVFLEESRIKKKIGTITLSINPFIPKPSTPFQWASMDTEKILRKKAKWVKDGLKQTPNIRINVESLRNAKIYALMSLGDQKCADLIEKARIKGWNFVFKQEKEYCDSIIYTPKDPDQTLPWDFLDNGLKKDFLRKEYLKAEQSKTSTACPMKDCESCGLCK